MSATALKILGGAAFGGTGGKVGAIVGLGSAALRCAARDEGEQETLDRIRKLEI